MTDTATRTAEPEGLGIPWRSPVLVAVLAASLLTPMDVPLISPVLPEIAGVFGVSEATAGLFVTLYALPGILLAPAIGALADHVGRRTVLAGCLTVFGVAGTAIAFTSEWRVALGLRLIQGLAAGSMLSALAMTVVGDRYSGRQHDSVMGVASATLSFGTAAYPLLGGYLAARAWNTPFLMYALALPVAGVVLFALDDDPAAETSERGYLREALHAVPTRRALGLYGVMFVSFGLVFGGLYTALPFYLSAAFDMTPGTVGLLTSVVLLVTAVVATQNGRFTGAVSTRALLSCGFALYAVGFVAVGLAESRWLLVGGLLLFGVGSGFITPTLFTRISALAPDHLRGGVMSLQTTTIGISQAVGPLVFTLVAGSVGYQNVFLGASGVAACGTALLAGVGIDG